MGTDRLARCLLHTAAVVLVFGAQVMVSATMAGAAPSVETAAPVALAGVRLTRVGVYTTREPLEGFTSGYPKSAEAMCPEGQRVLSGGAMVSTSTGSSTHGAVQLYALFPFNYPTRGSYFANAEENYVGYSEDWALTVYAVCAPVPASLGLEVVGRHSDDTMEPTAGGAWTNSVSAPCPAGKRVIGTGGVLGGSTNYKSFQQIRPNQQGAYTFVQGVLDKYLYEPFTVTAISICAYPIQGWHVVIDGTDYNNARDQAASVACEGQQIIGGGLTKGDDIGWAHVTNVIPIGPPFQALLVTGGIPSPHSTYNWNLAAWAICVDL